MSTFNSLYSTTTDILPPQMIPLKDKLKKPKDDLSWGEQCMDALETIGKQQFNGNLNLIENYEMIKGRFVYSHYFETEGYKDMLSDLMAEFELPNYLRHYDIISQVVNTLIGEWITNPDIYNVRELGENATNEYLRVKKELTKKYVFDKINNEVDRKLVNMGVELGKEDFQSQEEFDTYTQQIAQLREELTPKSIQKFMDTEFLTLGEMWGQSQKILDRQYFNLDEKERVELGDLLVADRCFRHFYLTNDYFNQETWNPINVFYYKSPDVNRIEDGDYVGRVFNLSISTIIDRYGHLMSKDDFDALRGDYEENRSKWIDSKYDWVYDKYMVPFGGYPEYDLMRQAWNISPQSAGIPQIDINQVNIFPDFSTIFSNREGYYFVTEAYWKSLKKLIKITYFDYDINDIVVKIVDENYEIPKGFKESKKIFDDDHEINTYVETYINEVWQGIKISTQSNKALKKDLYINIKPCEFQFKGDKNRYGCKLPVCGEIFSVRNSRSMSLVDMMKPYQIAFNVCMNQIYQLMEKEIGMFVVMDVNMFPNSKDWGGENSWDKWMLIAKQYGMLPADTSPQNIRNSLAASGGFLPKVLDLNLAAQMVSRQNLAVFFRNMALEQVGFNQYRIGAYSSQATATGVMQGQEKSYSQTKSYFTSFSNYLRRCTQMSLDMNQYIQSKKEDINILYTKSDFTKAFIKVAGIDILLPDLGVFLTNDQEEKRVLEFMKQYAVQNNTIGLSPVDVLDIIESNSPKEIRNSLKATYDKMMEEREREMQMRQQEIDNANNIKNRQIDEQSRQFDAQMDNNLDVNYLKKSADLLNQPNSASQSDNSELLASKIQGDQDYRSEKLVFDRENLKARIEAEKEKRAVEKAKIAADIYIQDKETESSMYMRKKK